MSDDDALSRVRGRLGRLEERWAIYEPILTGLKSVEGIPADLANLERELQNLKESRVVLKENIKTLIRDQEKVYGDVLRLLKERTEIAEREIRKCPIKDVVKEVKKISILCSDFTKLDARVATIETETKVLGSLSTEVANLETWVGSLDRAIESFKTKGWDLVFKMGPWLIAAVTSTWALAKQFGGP